MKVSVGIVCSVLGATIAFYLAIVSLVTLPADGTARWFAIAGITSLSLIAGLLINGMSMQDYFKVSRAYNTLTSRLSPLLYSGIEDVLQRRAKAPELEPGFYFTVFAPVKRLYRVIASTFPSEDPIRQIELGSGEGLPGFVAVQKIACFAPASRLVTDTIRAVFDRAGQQIGEATGVQKVNRGKIPIHQKWAYCRPIFEGSTSTPWSNRLVGLLLVHSSSDDGDRLFKTPDFQHLVDSVASEASSYLDALQVLVGEQKL